MRELTWLIERISYLTHVVDFLFFLKIKVNIHLRTPQIYFKQYLPLIQKSIKSHPGKSLIKIGKFS